MAFLDYSGLSRFLDKLKGYFVAGPASSTDAHVATFNGTTGKAIKDSGYTIAKSVPSDAKFSDTTYTFDGTYNSSTNKAATVSTVTNAIGALDGAITGTAGAGKTFTAFSQTDGKVTATIANISITKSQVSDFPTSMTPASHTHGNIQNGGTLQTTDVAIANGDKLVVTDSSDSNKVARTSLSFDGSTTTQCLTKKGTWASFTNNAGTITGITMNGASKGTSGVVDLGTVITSHQDISGKVSGPASATNNAVAIFDGTGGKTIKNSGFTIGKSVPSDAKFTDTTYSAATQSAAGLMSAADKTKLDGVATGATANVGTITGIKMNGASKGTSGVVDLGTVITAHQDISGKVSGPASATNNAVAIFDGTGGKIIKNSGFTIGKSVPSDAKFTDTTYSAATTSAAGLMSAEDKTKLNGIATGATANVGTITGITMNGASKGTSGVVDLGTVITSNPNYTPSTISAAGTAGLVPAPPNYDACLTSRHRWIKIFASQTITLSAGSWSSATPPTQTVTAMLVTVNSDVIVGPASSITNEQLEALSRGKIVCTAQAAESLTFTCYGTEPTVNIPVTYMSFSM